MRTIEDLVELFQDRSQLPPFTLGRRFSVPLIGRRLFVARGPDGEYEVFIRGPIQSFGVFEPAAGMAWGTYHEPSGNQIEALRFSLDYNDANCRIMAHLAYEALQRITTDASISNDQLLVGLDPYIRLVSDRSLLEVGEQQGLLGELLLLERLVALCHAVGLPIANSIDAWKGWQRGASRDFVRNGIAVEVKSTSRTVREHEISSLHQLERDSHDIALYLYSLSVAADPSGSIRLVDQVETVSLAIGPLARVFEQMLLTRGYDCRLRNSYRLGPAFSLTRFTTALFEVNDELSRMRESSFVGNCLPLNVRGVTYLLNLQGVSGMDNPLTPPQADQILVAMLR